MSLRPVHFYCTSRFTLPCVDLHSRMALVCVSGMFNCIPWTNIMLLVVFKIDCMTGLSGYVISWDRKFKKQSSHLTRGNNTTLEELVALEWCRPCAGFPWHFWLSQREYVASRNIRISRCGSHAFIVSTNMRRGHLNSSGVSGVSANVPQRLRLWRSHWPFCRIMSRN